MIMKRLEHLKKEKESAPNFRGRLTIIDDHYIPIRAYFHRSGFDDFSGVKNRSLEEEAKNHLLFSVFGEAELAKGSDYFLAAMWGNNGAKMIDLFGYSGTQNWPGNPEISSFVFKDGILVPEERQITCGDTLIVLGVEERYRRTTNDLIDYMEHAPPIEGLLIQ